MKRASALTAAGVIVIANVFGLVHACRNRTGPVEADIRLTERELPLSYLPNNRDSIVTLDLRWMDPPWTSHGWTYLSDGRLQEVASWLDQQTLQELGFDTSVAPSDKTATSFYARQRERRAFVALEYEGLVWRKYLEQTDREKRENAESETHLVAIDAASGVERLRNRHLDRNSVIIVPAVVRIFVQHFFAANPWRPPLLSGLVQEIPTSIQVNRPFSDLLRDRDRRNVKYRVHLRYGTSLEPWIVALDQP
jgi:hypothetical protein